MNTILGNKKNLIIVALGTVFLVIGGLSIAFFGLNFGPGGGSTGTARLQADLQMWGVWDNSSLMREYIDQFNKQYPNVNIEYRKQTIENYEDQLVNALAEERGPDIFAMHHTWLNKHKEKMTAMPKDVMTEKTYRERFVDVVEEDFITRKGAIYGVPLYVDTLALYYNRDMFDDAGIVDPPTTWTDFQSDVKKLTKINEFGRITQAGTTLGTVDNINRPQDIVAVIMEQSLAQQGKTMPNFGNDAGERGLEFYTDFADPQKTVYAWNKNRNYSVDAFADGKAAMTVGYAYLVDRIKAKSPRLNFKVAELPQIAPADSNVANYTNYWGYTVSSQTSKAERFASYLFLRFLTTKKNSQKYFRTTNRPTPRQDLIEKQSKDLQYGVFVKQILHAETWDQPDNSEVDRILAQMIKSVNNGSATSEEAASNAADQIQSLTN